MRTMPAITFERKVLKTGDSLRINLPLEICQALDIKKGDTLAIGVNDHQVTMEKVRKK
jgi:antitoxin component of MazEF toxin-antitoxin module